MATTSYWVPFDKAHVHGNDFILIDLQALDHSFLLENIAHFCRKTARRHHGIGADGVLLLKEHTSYNFEMFFYNPDGSTSMCGNGAKALTLFAKRQGFFPKEQQSVQFLHKKEVYKATIEEDNVTLQMPDFPFVKHNEDYTIVHNGAKHCVQFTNHLATEDLSTGYQNMLKEKKCQHHNLNLVQYLDNHTIKIRTYENGVFSETLSCGTGAIAAALASVKKYQTQSPTIVHTAGGVYKIHFKVGVQVTEPHTQFTSITSTGTVSWICKGQYYYTLD